MLIGEDKAQKGTCRKMFFAGVASAMGGYKTLSCYYTHVEEILPPTGDGESYLEQAGAINRQRRVVGAFNAGLLLPLLASGAMSAPEAHGSPFILGCGLTILLAVPVAKFLLDSRSKAVRNYGLYVALLGTALMWGPVYLETMIGELPEIVLGLSLVGVALLVASVFWPSRSINE